ncbi:hypothetical protein AGLY_006418 [Aphis glycines]|uniref:Uncharacterized protein n=1 Tax=Aphis glycines TaxID=307491 RepID=A0A6G0TTB2_APHGL|nr:hypothetical protein AGLY_006418 [Aphis glycines]
MASPMPRHRSRQEDDYTPTDLYDCARNKRALEYLIKFTHGDCNVSTAPGNPMTSLSKTYSNSHLNLYKQNMFKQTILNKYQEKLIRKSIRDHNLKARVPDGIGTSACLSAFDLHKQVVASGNTENTNIMNTRIFNSFLVENEKWWLINKKKNYISLLDENNFYGLLKKKSYLVNKICYFKFKFYEFTHGSIDMVIKWVKLCCIVGIEWTLDIKYVGRYIGRVKFESNNRYHCIKKTILNRNDLSAKDIFSNYLMRNLILHFQLQLYKKIDLVENWFFVKIHVFPYVFVVFPDFFENYWNFFTFDLNNVPRIFNFQLETTPEVLNRNIISTSYGVHRQKRNTHTLFFILNLILNNSEQSDECIDFTMISCNNNIMNFLIEGRLLEYSFSPVRYIKSNILGNWISIQCRLLIEITTYPTKTKY